MSNLTEIQKQIKAFNKALSRADKADAISGEYLRLINDLIDVDRMTSSGNAKAGTKYLENMTYKDLMSYQSDITAAREMLKIATITNELDMEFVKDKKDALWSLYNKLEDNGIKLDSDQVHDVETGEVNIEFKSVMRHMNKLLTTKNYGVSDFSEWWDKQKEKGLKQG